MSDFIYTPLDNLIDDCTGKTRIERDKLLADRAHLIAALKEAKVALETIDKEVRGLAKGLLKSKPVICPDSDTLHWEGVSPKDLEPCEYDVALSKGWMKLLKNTSEKALATINHALEMTKSTKE